MKMKIRNPSAVKNQITINRIYYGWKNRRDKYELEQQQQQQRITENQFGIICGWYGFLLKINMIKKSTYYAATSSSRTKAQRE